jgi:outer membrane protein assembly complex protein YaeT
MKRRWLRLAVLVPIIILGNIILAFFLLQTPPAARLIFRQLQNYLKNESNIDLEASGFHLNTLRGRVRLEGVEVRSISALNLPPILRIDRIDAQLDIFKIIRGFWGIEELRLTAPDIHWVIEENGNTNLPKAQGAASGSMPEFVIAYAEAGNCSFRFEDFQHGIAALFPQWQLRVEGDRSSLSHRILFNIQQESTFSYPGHTIPVDDLQISAMLNNTALQIRSAQILAAGSKLTIAGSLSNFSGLTLDLHLNPELDLNHIVRLAGLNQTIRGRASGTILLNGTLDNLHFEARMRGDDIGAGEFPPADYDVSTQMEWIRESRQLRVRNLEIASSQESLGANAELFFSKEAKPEGGVNSLEAEVVNLDLIPVSKQLGLPFNISSRGTGRISLEWKDAFEASRISGAMQLNLATTRESPSRDLLPIAGAVNARIQAGRSRLSLQSVELLGARISGQLSLHPTEEIGGTIQGTVPQIDRLATQLSRYLGKGDDPFGGTKISGPVQFNARVGGNLKNLTATVAAEAPQLEVATLGSIAVQTAATFEGSHIIFQSTIILPENSTISAWGNLNFDSPSPALSIEARADQIPLEAVASLAKRTIPATGSLSGELHLNGTMDKLLGSASLAGRELTLYREPVGELYADLDISGTEIRSTRLRLQKNPQTQDSDYVEAAFACDLDSGEFSFQADGKDLNLGRTELPGGIPIDGTISLNASGMGTLAQPEIVLNIGSSRTRINGKLLGTLLFDGTLQDHMFALNSRAPDINVSSTIQIAASDPYAFVGEIHINQTDLSLFDLKGADEQPISGMLEALVTASGDLKDLVNARGLAQIQSFRVQAGGLEMHTEGPIQVLYRKESLEIYPSATIASGNSLLEIAGVMPLKPSGSTGSLLVKGQVDLAQATGFLSLPEGYDVTGSLNIELVLEGALENINSSGSIRMSDGMMRFPDPLLPLTNVKLDGAIKDGSFILKKAEADWDQGKVAITGELPFGLLPESKRVKFQRKKGPALFALDLLNLKPESTGMLPEGVSGLISLHASGKTNDFDLDSLTAQITVQTLNLSANDISLTQHEPSIIHLNDGIATISGLILDGPATSLEVLGSGGLRQDSPLDLRLEGNIEAALLTLTNRDLKASGSVQIHAAVTGTRQNPNLSGRAAMSGGRLSLRNPRIVADNLNVQLILNQDEIAIQQFEGSLNGGTVAAEGTVRYRDGTLNDFNVKATLKDCYLNSPEGLKTFSEGTITLTSSNESIIVGGDIHVVESSFREPIEIGGQIMRYLKSQQVVMTDLSRNELLERMNLNIGLQTDTPLLVQNNLAKVEANANLRLVGSYYEPSIVGRIALNEGGEISLNQRTYYINRGIITLSNQNRIEPELDIRAQTEVSNNTITLLLSGTPEKLMTTLTSEPESMSEAEILSLLLTGRRASEMEGREAEMARTQAMSLLAGQAGEQVARQARQALGLSTVRIDPGLISTEKDPGARLTLGQDITDKFSLAYSMNLVNGGDQIWATRYDIMRGLTTQATRQTDNSYRFELRHNLQFGGSSRSIAGAAAVPKLRIGAIQFQGNPLFSDQILIDQLKVKPGAKYDFPKVQKGLDRLSNFYAEKERLEANIRIHRDIRDGTIDLGLNVDPGPIVDFFFDGVQVSKGTRKKVEQAWVEGVFDSERLDDAVRAIHRPLLQQGYFQSKVTSGVEADDGKKQVYFNIDPGSRFANVKLDFPGASEIEASGLIDALNDANMELEVYADPQTVADYLTRYYRERGYLQASVGLPQPQLNAESGTGTVAIPVHEGPLFTVGDLEFSGNNAFGYDDLWVAIPTSSGSRYNPDTLQKSIDALESFYQNHGYNDATITYRILQDPDTAHAHVTFHIKEYRQSIIRDIVIEGNRGTSDTFVKRQLDFQIGDVLDFRKINETRRRLYDTTVYSLVDFQTEEMTPSDPDSQTKDMRIRIRLQEIRPYRLQYGLFYDTDRRLGGIMEIQDRNLLGRAADLGLRLRYDSDFKEARLFLYQPFVTKVHLRTDATVFYQRETRSPYRATRVGFSLIQQQKLKKEFRFDYGYRFDYVRPDEDSVERTYYEENSRFGRPIFTLSRDTRDSIFDATRGEFSSHSLEIGTRWLGSKFGFVRYYGQYFRYVLLDKLIWRQRWEELGRTAPPRLLYSGALRFGLIKAFNGSDIPEPNVQESNIPRQERFYAGGGTTMRGFRQDQLGPFDIKPLNGDQATELIPAGGEVVFLFNNEIRFPIFSILHGVSFLDIGNVYRTVPQFWNDFSLRTTAGFGLRIKIKFVPLRFDYGFKLDRKPGESRGAFFFSIGQAF